MVAAGRGFQPGGRHCGRPRAPGAVDGALPANPLMFVAVLMKMVLPDAQTIAARDAWAAEALDGAMVSAAERDIVIRVTVAETGVLQGLLRGGAGSGAATGVGSAMKGAGFMHISVKAGIAALAILGAQAAHAQLPGGLKMPGVPDVSGLGVEDAAGVLSYCVKNNMLGGTDASSVLGTLSGKPEVEESDDFKAGAGGLLDTGADKPLSMDSLPKDVRKQVCKQVLKQAKSFL